MWSLGPVAIAAAASAGALGLLYLLDRVTRPARFHPSGKVVLITGGSSGIGLAAATILLQRGAAGVALVARRVEVLDAALQELVAAGFARDRILCVPGDVSREASMVQAAQLTVEKFGALHAVINSAGLSLAQVFETSTEQQVQDVFTVNVLGTRNATFACLPHIRASSTPSSPGRIVFVSSLAGVCGVYGYTAYAASKFALTGLAQALQMEVRRYHIRVCLNLPPDTDTPMFRSEADTIPPETIEISSGAGLFKAPDVALSLVDGMCSGAFVSTVGLEGWLARHVTVGMNPDSLASVVLQGLFMGLFRVIAAGYTVAHYRTVDRHWRKKALPSGATSSALGAGLESKKAE